MFDKFLQAAHGSGAEILVQIRDYCCEQFRGRVLDLDEDYFSLFHSGAGGGVHWAFKRSDIAFLGLLVDPPDPMGAFARNLDNAVEPSTNTDFQYKPREGE